MESGAQWPIVASVGQRDGLSFRNYVDLPEELSNDTAQLFIQSYDFPAAGDCVGPGGTAVGAPLGTPPPPTPPFLFL